MSITVTRNGRPIAPDSLGSSVAGELDIVRGSIADSMSEAAFEAVQAMKTVIGTDDGADALGILDSQAAAEWREEDHPQGRVLTGDWRDSLDTIVKTSTKERFEILAGAEDAPEYFFGQDEGWDSSDAPQGAAYENVEGAHVRDAGLAAAKGVLDHELLGR
jgi:hypothetical protein